MDYVRFVLLLSRIENNSITFDAQYDAFRLEVVYHTLGCLHIKVLDRLRKKTYEDI